MELEYGRESLQALELLMNEFFNPQISKPRKLEIENQIQLFQSTNDCWRQCIFFLTYTENPYVSMCCLTVLESLINNKWMSFNWKTKIEIRNFLWDYLNKHYGSLSCSLNPVFIRNKFAKLVIDIARHDWPHFYPDFFSNIIQLIESEHSRILGLVLLKTASEELTKPRDDVISNRRDELFKLMQANSIDTLKILTAILEEIAAKKQESVITRTPPPSPIHSTTHEEQLQTEQSNLVNTNQQSTIPIDISSSSRHNSNEICTEVLQTVQQIFNWVTISSIPQSLIKIIFHFASAMSYTQDDDDISTLAITVLSELLYRREIQVKDKTIVYELYDGATHLLKCYVANENEQNVCVMFVEKFNEYLQLLVELNFLKICQDGNFDRTNFLSALFRYTFQQRNQQNFLFCIEIWKVFLSYAKPETVAEYGDLIMGLTNSTLDKIKFEKNYKELCELNFDIFTFEDNIDPNLEIEKSDFEYFIDKCANLLAILVNYAPIDIFNMLTFMWYSYYDIYLKIQMVIDNTSYELTLTDSNELHHLLNIIQDLATITSCLSHISACFSDKDKLFYQTSSEMVKTFIHKLTTITLFTVQKNIYKVKTKSKELQFAFNNLHCNLLMCLISWCLWPGLKIEINNNNFSTLIAQITVPLITDKSLNNTLLCTRAIHLLVRFLNVAPITFLNEQTALYQLMPYASLNSQLNEKNANDLRYAICNIVALTNPQTDTKINDLRCSLLKELRNIFLVPLSHLDGNNAQYVKNVIMNVLPRLTMLIDQYDKQNVIARKAVSAIISEPLDKVLEVFSKFPNDPDIREYSLTLLYSVCKIFIVNLLPAEKRKFVEIIIEVTLRNSNNSNQLIICGLDKVLKIFALLIAEYDVRYLHSNIVEFCLKNVLPLLIQTNWQLTDICYAFYEVLHQSVYYCWNHFFKPFNKLPANSKINAEPLQNEENFLAIMQAFGEALLQNDFNIFRISLKSLENINERWRLYTKLVFREKLMAHFLSALLNALLNKTHSILYEEILHTICQMAQVDLNAFIQWYLPSYLNSISTIDDQQKQKLIDNFSKDPDEPTVKQSLAQLVVDLRCYCLCNSTLTGKNIFV